MRLIDDLALPERCIRMLQLLQERDLTWEEILMNLQQLEQINVYNAEYSLEQIGNVHTFRNTDNHACTMISNCSFCGESHKGKCPAFGKTCNISKKRNHFAVVC